MSGPPTTRLAPLFHPGGRWSAFEHLVETTSTNDLVAARARAGAPSGLVVMADRQRAGRGRAGRRWEDAPGGSLLVSCLVDPPPQPTLASLAAGLSVTDAASRVGVGNGLKWPNDVLVDGRKCAGVLIEVVQRRLVIGLGINVDWRGRARSGEAATWASLAEVAESDIDRFDVLADLLVALDRRLIQAEHEPDRLLDAYRRRCTTLGREVRVIVPGGVLVGTAEDVDSTGALQLRCGQRSVTVTVGDVEHLRPLD